MDKMIHIWSRFKFDLNHRLSWAGLERHSPKHTCIKYFSLSLNVYQKLKLSITPPRHMTEMWLIIETSTYFCICISREVFLSVQAELNGTIIWLQYSLRFEIILLLLLLYACRFGRIWVFPVYVNHIPEEKHYLTQAWSLFVHPPSTVLLHSPLPLPYISFTLPEPALRLWKGLNKPLMWKNLLCCSLPYHWSESEPPPETESFCLVVPV